MMHIFDFVKIAKFPESENLFSKSFIIPRQKHSPRRHSQPSREKS
jgi:hypothetical protein